jgi:hypothetical protein
MGINWFVCWSSLSLWAMLWFVISSRTVGISRPVCRLLFGMYHGALTIVRNTLFWKRCKISMLDWEAVPQRGIPYVHIGFNIVLYSISLFSSDNSDFLPMIQYIRLNDYVIISVRSEGPYSITVSRRQDGQETCKVFYTTLHILSTRLSRRRGGQSLRKPFLNDMRIENGVVVLLELYLLRQDKSVFQRSWLLCKKRDCTDIRLDALLYDGASQPQKWTHERPLRVTVHSLGFFKSRNKRTFLPTEAGSNPTFPCLLKGFLWAATDTASWIGMDKLH